MRVVRARAGRDAYMGPPRPTAPLKPPPPQRRERPRQRRPQRPAIAATTAGGCTATATGAAGAAVTAKLDAAPVVVKRLEATTTRASWHPMRTQRQTENMNGAFSEKLSVDDNSPPTLMLCAFRNTAASDAEC